MAVQEYIDTLQIVSCCNCHITFGMDNALYHQRKKDHRSFWCPNGHSQYFTAKSTEEKLRAQLAHEEGRVAMFRAEAETAEARRRAEKAAKTRIKNRIANGVCPCCKRSFQNVKEHMKTQHPDWSGDAKGHADGD